MALSKRFQWSVIAEKKSMEKTEDDVVSNENDAFAAESTKEETQERRRWTQNDRSCRYQRVIGCFLPKTIK